jgi:GGDEF domain-containing protein
MATSQVATNRQSVDPVTLRSRLRTWWSRVARPPAAWSSACLYLVACALLLTGALTVPMGDRFAHPVDLGLAALCAALAGLTWFAGRRLGGLLPHVAVLLGIAVITAAIAVSHTFGGETYPAFGYMWSTVYMAYFLTRRSDVAYVVLIAISFAVALALADVGSAIEAWIVVVASVTALTFVLHSLVELLARQAERDPLTGALNRKGLERQAGALRAGAARRGSPVTLVAIDLDGFKHVNDRVGHVAADHLLTEVTDHWRGRLRGSDLVGRVGGDEFVLILEDTTPDQAAGVLADLRIGSPLPWSAGTTEMEVGELMEEAVKRADVALYQAKQG